MEPISIGLMIITAIATKALVIAIITIILLTLKVIFNWFRKREKTIVSDPKLKAIGVPIITGDIKTDKNNLEKTIQEEWIKVEKGQPHKMGFITGVFNTKTGKLQEAAQFNPDKIDKEFMQSHKGKLLTTYS